MLTLFQHNVTKEVLILVSFTIYEYGPLCLTHVLLNTHKIYIQWATVSRVSLYGVVVSTGIIHWLGHDWNGDEVNHGANKHMSIDLGSSISSVSV